MMIQIAIVIFSLFAISRIILRVKDKRLSLGGMFFWLTIFVSIIVLVLMPKVMSFLSNIAGVQRGVDLFIYLSIVALFYLLFKLFIMVEKLQQEITSAIKGVAILKHEFDTRSEKEHRQGNVCNCKVNK